MLPKSSKKTQTLNFSHREPKGHYEILTLFAEAFKELASDAVMPLLKAHEEPIFGAMSRLLANGESTLTSAKLREMILKRNQYQKDYLDRWMATKTASGEPIDGIIAPVAPAAAPRLGLGEKVSYLGYTGFGNLLGLFSFFPASRSKSSRQCRSSRVYIPCNVCR